MNWSFQMRTGWLPVWALAAALAFLTGCGGSEEVAPRHDDEMKPVVANARKASPPDVEVASPDESCVSSCNKECTLSKRDVAAFYQKKESSISSAPFEVEVERVYFQGACAAGPEPAKRKNTAGISAVLEATVTYKGSDILMSAEVGGTLLLDVNGKRFAEVPVAPAADGANITRSVRGADPWTSGQKRSMRFVSRPVSEGFCEVVPAGVKVVVGLTTMGIETGRQEWTVAAVPVHWEEVVGMALQQQVSIAVDGGVEPANAHFARFEQVLVTRLDGTTEWTHRDKTIYARGLKKSKGTSFPVEVSGGQWQVKVSGVSTQNVFDDYSQPGEDEFLVLVETEIINTGEDKATVGAVRAQLELAPGKWASPLPLDIGQLKRDETLEAGASVSGVLVFGRTRFERPFRLKIAIPEGGPLYLDVFDYSVGPERSPL